MYLQNPRRRQSAPNKKKDTREFVFSRMELQFMVLQLVANSTAIFDEAMKEMGVSNQLKLITQPAQSPDLNVSDLGIFGAM